ncbi:MAG: LptA/OstA family protein [Robiginitomaculum sp.]|nr:LptA/OstA family protein [Robiginitomaculum sp.]MDQ7076495.1 LptA/OstA family protein [Robiginitomaculum sp.]
MNKAFIRTAALALLASSTALPAVAQLSAKRGAIVINSDKLEVIDAKNEALFSGRVDAVQDDARLRADKLDVLFDKKAAKDDAANQPGAGWGDVKTIIATGNVYYVTPKQVAKAEKAVYDVAKDQVVMSGNVVVTQGKNVIRGDKLVLQISTGRAIFDTTKNNGTPSGRVRAAFFPAKKEKSTAEDQAN